MFNILDVRQTNEQSLWTEVKSKGSFTPSHRSECECFLQCLRQNHQLSTKSKEKGFSTRNIFGCCCTELKHTTVNASDATARSSVAWSLELMIYIRLKSLKYFNSWRYFAKYWVPFLMLPFAWGKGNKACCHFSKVHSKLSADVLTTKAFICHLLWQHNFSTCRFRRDIM